MKRTGKIAATLMILLADLLLTQELVVDVPPERARELFERNEMQYEELRWHSFPDRVRIAGIDRGILREPGLEFTIMPFENEPPILVRSNGVDGNRWNGSKTTKRIPEDILRTALEAQGAPEVLYNEPGQRYTRLREEKEAYLSRVAERIAARKRNQAIND